MPWRRIKNDYYDDLGQLIREDNRALNKIKGGFGFDAVSTLDDFPNFVGGSFSGGMGVGVDVHVVASKTETVAKMNIFDTVKKSFIDIITWVGGILS